MRRALAVVALALVVSATSSAAGPKVLLGITGNVGHFKQLTGQQSAVHQAFLGWGQGQGYGSPFKDLLDDVRPGADVPPGHRCEAAEQERGDHPARRSRPAAATRTSSRSTARSASSASSSTSGRWPR